MTEHRHYFDVDVDQAANLCTELDDQVCIRAWNRSTVGRPDPEGSYFVAHERPPEDPAGPARCEGRVDITEIYRTGQNGGRDPGPTWVRAEGTSLADGNLTLTPSIRCLEHDGMVAGGHGFIQDGRWVPA